MHLFPHILPEKQHCSLKIIFPDLRNSEMPFYARQLGQYVILQCLLLFLIIKKLKTLALGASRPAFIYRHPNFYTSMFNFHSHCRQTHRWTNIFLLLVQIKKIIIKASAKLRKLTKNK